MINEELTSRQQEILEGLAQGLSNREIAQKLFLSEKTVKSHSRDLFIRIGARNRTHAVVIGIREGLVDVREAV